MKSLPLAVMKNPEMMQTMGLRGSLRLATTPRIFVFSLLLMTVHALAMAATL